LIVVVVVDELHYEHGINLGLVVVVIGRGTGDVVMKIKNGLHYQQWQGCYRII